VTDAPMHADEVPVDEETVRRLLRAQFPAWAELGVARVSSAGTDNAMFRLGDDLVVRLPRIGWAEANIPREARWLPMVEPSLPLAVPTPIAVGVPDERYPYPWSIARWIPGEDLAAHPVRDRERAAIDLAQFVRALRAVHLPDEVGLSEGRGGPLAGRDADTREAIRASRSLVDAEAVTDLWDRAIHLPVWDGPAVPLHADLHAGNLLAESGVLGAVLDWGSFAAGDPAVDCMPAWTLFGDDPAAHRAFREHVDVDEATWLRGRAWAVSVGMIVLPYYVDRNPTLVSIARAGIAAALASA
jgi:aminoglycoside phosphotransferase (APT) family kinase protein